MVLPASALAQQTADSPYESAETVEALDQFVAAWSEALLSQDKARLDAVRADFDFTFWSADFKQTAIDRLFDAIEAHRPADAAPTTNAEDIARVKNVLALYVFEPTFFDGQEPPSPEDAITLDDVQSTDPLAIQGAAINQEIVDKATPFSAALANNLVDQMVEPEAALSLQNLLEQGRLGELLAQVPDLGGAGVPTVPGAPEVPEPPAVPADEVEAILAPYADNAQNLVPIAGTYTLRVVTASNETIYQNVPFGLVVPIDIDVDGTTGLGGFDLAAGVVLDAAPDVDPAVDGTDVTATVSNIAPALVVKRIGHDELPDFQPLEVALVEAYIALNGGSSVAHVGVDARGAALPDEVAIAFFTDVTAHSETLTELQNVVAATVPVANEDVRNLADAIAAKSGQPIPWETIDGAPSQADAVLKDATATMEAQLEAARREAEAHEAAVRDAAAPVTTEAAKAQAEAEKNAGDARAAAEAALAPVLADAQKAADAAQGTAAEAQKTAEEAAAAAMTQAEELAAPATTLIQETRTQVEGEINALVAQATAALEEKQGEADAALAPVRAEIAAAKATAYEAAVAANVAAGQQKNVFVWTANGFIKTVEETELPTPPAPVAQVAPTPELPPELQPVQDAADAVGAEVAPITGAAEETAADAEAAAGDAVATTGATTATPGSDFRLQVRTVNAKGDIVLVAGVTNFDDDGKATDVTAAAMRLARPPAALNVTLRATDGTTVRLESTDPTTLSGFVVRYSTDGAADVTAFVMGPLPKWIQVDFTGSKYNYDASAVLPLLGIERVGFATYADFASWLAGGALTASYTGIAVRDIPTQIRATVAGANAQYEASGRLGSVELITARFAANRLAGDFVRFYLGSIPTAFTLATGPGGSTFAYEGNGPLGVLDVMRTNGPVLGSAPAPGFAVMYRQGAAQLAHLRILNIVSVAAASGSGAVFMDARLQGGYPFAIVTSAGDLVIYALIQEMPNHLRVTMKPANGVDVELVMEPASSKGIYATANLPQLGGKIAVLGITNLPSYMRLVMDSRVPSFSYNANAGIRGITAGVYMPSGALAAFVGFYNIPQWFYFGMQKFGSGLPNVGYSAAASTLSIDIFVEGDLLGAFPGHAFIRLVNIPRLGLGFGVDGNRYTVQAFGDRLTLFYMDVGYRFNGAFNYANNFVDSWWLLAGAVVNLNYNVNIRHFYVLMQNLRVMNFVASMPRLHVDVDGVFQTAFNLDLLAGLYARAYIYLLRWIPLLDISISWGWNGPLPIGFTTWSYAWYEWAIVILSIPIICRVTWRGVSWGLWQVVLVVGIRLPASFYTTINGFGVAYGSIDPFVNPGGIIPFWMIYTYALASGFSVYAYTGTRTLC